MSNFGNINYKTELEMKVSLFEKENFELRDQLLIIKQLKTGSKIICSPADISTATNTITKAAQTNDSINSDNNNTNKNNNSNNNINNNNCKNKNNDNNNNKNKQNTNSTD